MAHNPEVIEQILQSDLSLADPATVAQQVIQFKADLAKRP